MKTLTTAALAVALIVPAAFAGEPTLPEAQATYAEARKMLGVVPAALRYTPDDQVTPVWNQLKALAFNPSTAINGKTKELLGLSVASTIPCAYCVYFHQEAAKLNGANEKELKDALGLAAQVRGWAAVVDGQNASMGKPAAPSKEQEAVFADVKATLGNVPEFISRYPAVALAPAWAGFKTAMMGEGGSIAPKDRALIGVAVASQIPSTPCVNSYSEMAKKLGASEAEISEAVALAGLTRSGSTVLNGSGTDLGAFKKEVDGIVKFIKAQMGKKVAGR